MKYGLILGALIALASTAHAHVRYSAQSLAECSDSQGNEVTIQKSFRNSERTTAATIAIVPKDPAYLLQLFNAGSNGEAHLNSFDLEDVWESPVGQRSAGALVFKDKSVYVTNLYEGVMEISGSGSSIHGVRLNLQLDPSKSSAGFAGPDSLDLNFGSCRRLQ